MTIFILKHKLSGSFLPDFPGSLAGVPQVVQLRIVAQGVHRFPEARVTVGVHLAVLGEVFQRGTFEDGRIIVGGNVVEHFRLANEITRIDPVAVAVRLLLEGKYLVCLQIYLQGTELAAGLVGGEGQSRTGTFVGGDAVGNVQVCHAIPIGQEKTLVAHVFLNTLDTSAGLGVQAGINHCHPPVLGMIVENGRYVVGQIDGHVAVVAKIVGEVFLDDILLVTATDDEVRDAVVAVSLHDMPQDGLPADFHHWFGNQIGGLAQSGAEATGKDYCFHDRKMIIYQCLVFSDW